MTEFNRTTLRRCSITHLNLPEELFVYRGRGNQNKSVLGVAWVNASQRSINGRYAAIRKQHYPNDSHHRRRIRMHSPWVNDPTAFAWYILTTLGLPGDHHGDKMSLDRIDNNRGYEPGNLRWATAYEQLMNREAA